MTKLGVIGFPGNYGGASVELDCQLTIWKKMGIELHIIPTYDVSNEPLLIKTKNRATIHNVKEYSALKDMPVISFCNDEFLSDIAIIKEHASKTIWVNCMTWLFGPEKEAHKKGLIDLFLYQNPRSQKKVNDELKALNDNYNWKVFTSWFDNSKFPYHKERTADKFRFGRISREDGDKYTSDCLWIYETMVAPMAKSCVILGYDDRSKKKIGEVPEWIRAYPGSGISQQEFYAHSSCIVQKTETYENWPRVCMEAFASGSVLIVDNRGGWKDMVIHNETGYLCNDSRDFVYYASKMAYEPLERDRISENALKAGKEMFGEEKSMESWKEVLGC